MKISFTFFMITLNYSSFLLVTNVTRPSYSWLREDFFKQNKPRILKHQIMHETARQMNPSIGWTKFIFFFRIPNKSLFLKIVKQQNILSIFYLIQHALANHLLFGEFGVAQLPRTIIRAFKEGQIQNHLFFLFIQIILEKNRKPSAVPLYWCPDHWSTYTWAEETLIKSTIRTEPTAILANPILWRWFHHS